MQLSLPRVCGLFGEATLGRIVWREPATDGTDIGTVDSPTVEMRGSHGGWVFCGGLSRGEVNDG